MCTSTFFALTVAGLTLSLFKCSSKIAWFAEGGNVTGTCYRNEVEVTNFYGRAVAHSITSKITGFGALFV